jgi:hypothetical protein
VTGKAEALVEVKTFEKNSGANSEVKVMVYGDTAIAIGILKAKTKDPSGKIADLNLQWTDTWVKMPNGNWQCVASHGSSIKIRVTARPESKWPPLPMATHHFYLPGGKRHCRNIDEQQTGRGSDRVALHLMPSLTGHSCILRSNDLPLLI